MRLLINQPLLAEACPLIAPLYRDWLKAAAVLAKGVINTETIRRLAAISRQLKEALYEETLIFLNEGSSSVFRNCGPLTLYDALLLQALVHNGCEIVDIKIDSLSIIEMTIFTTKTSVISTLPKGIKELLLTHEFYNEFSKERGEPGDSLLGWNSVEKSDVQILRLKGYALKKLPPLPRNAVRAVFSLCNITKFDMGLLPDTIQAIVIHSSTIDELVVNKLPSGLRTILITENAFYSENKLSDEIRQQFYELRKLGININT